MNVKKIFVIISLMFLAIIIVVSFFWKQILWSLILFGPLILLGFYDIIQKKHTIKKNFPVIGHLRYLMEAIRPEIMQYFVETDTQGRPINRLFRSLIYQRSKREIDTTPFGTQMDVYRTGYEWMDHSLYAKNYNEIGKEHRVLVGSKDCTKPYSASILNISAMSFGSLSKNAVMAMNKGAKLGCFAQNTGEGGLSPYHLKYGGDIIWQIGTGYFSARNKDGSFSPEAYQKNAILENVKMIELKISQGAKPGHGGILPAKKNTPEIAAIRLVEPNTDVLSPPRHTAFDGVEGLMHFIKQLRDLSDGKPVGFKICIGKKEEFINICKAMLSTGILPDFITIDGGEGGTGAAPIEFSNSLGMPLRDGLAFAINTLIGFNLKKDIKVIVSGKVFSGFHIVRLLALGADMCNSARAMMVSVGCIQSLKCNLNTCPVGVATQDPSLINGLDVDDKAIRVANYHQETIKSFIELIAAAGLTNAKELNRSYINRRISLNSVLRYDEIYPNVKTGSLI